MSYGLGIIGAGRVSQEHARAATANGVRIAAVCDIDLEKAKRFAVEHCPGASPHVCDSVEELTALPSVDAALVAVPNAAHRDVAIACLNAGKHILLEKPMATNLAACNEIIAARDQNARHVQMGFVCRGAPKVHAARDLIQSGALGNVYHIKASMYRRRGIPGLGRWFTTRAISGGGVLIDIGVHLIDLVMHLSGATRAATVSATCESRFGSPIKNYVFTEMWAGPPDPEGVFDVEDSACGFIRFDNGITLELNVAWASNMPEGLMPEGITLLGDRGGCFFDLWGDRFTLTTEQDGKVIDSPIAFDGTDAWNRAWNWQHARFARVVAEGDTPHAPAEAGRAVQEVIDAMYRSSATCREASIG